MISITFPKRWADNFPARWSRHIAKEDVIGLIPVASQFVRPDDASSTWAVTDSYDELYAYDNAVAGNYVECFKELEARYPSPDARLAKVVALCSDIAYVKATVDADATGVYAPLTYRSWGTDIPRYAPYAREFCVLPYLIVPDTFAFAKPIPRDNYTYYLRDSEIEELASLSALHGDLLVLNVNNMTLKYNLGIGKPCKIIYVDNYRGWLIRYDAGIERRREIAQKAKERASQKKIARITAVYTARSAVYNAGSSVIDVSRNGLPEIVKNAVSHYMISIPNADRKRLLAKAIKENPADKSDRYVMTEHNENKLFESVSACLRLYHALELYAQTRPVNTYEYRQTVEWKHMIDAIAALPADVLPGEWGCIPGFDKFVAAEAKLLSAHSSRGKRVK